MQISKNFTLAELTKTSAPFNNYPQSGQLLNLIYLVNNLLQPLRDLYGEPISINSGFRSKAVNEYIGGAANSHNSQHLSGEAVDIDAEEDNHILFNLIRENFVFDQLIWEYGSALNPNWIHVSLKKSGNRGEILRISRVKGRKVTEKIK